MTFIRKSAQCLLALSLLFATRAARAELEEQWSGPTLSSGCVDRGSEHLCAVSATVGDLERLPAGDRQLNLLALLAGRERDAKGWSTYFDKVNEYRSSLVDAARPRFPSRTYPEVDVLSKTPLLVRGFTVAADSLVTLERSTPHYAEYVRATAATMGYPNIVLDEDLEQPALANGALCIGCGMEIGISRGTKRVTGVEQRFVPITAHLARVPRTTPTMAAVALNAMRPPSPGDASGSPVLALLRDPTGKGRLVWAVEQSPEFVCHYPPSPSDVGEPTPWLKVGSTIVFALDVDSLAIIGTFRADLFKHTVEKAKRAKETKAPSVATKRT